MTFDDWLRRSIPMTGGQQYIASAAWEAGAASRDAEIAYLQSRIDELMLEYCPNEMTKDQLDNWAEHQRPVDESKLPESIRARSTK